MKKHLLTIVLAGAAALALTPAHALKVYKLQGNQYAIICDDGVGYSFSGSANGAQEAGALLCEEHGGIVDVQDTTPAHKALRDRGGAKPTTKSIDKASPKLYEGTTESKRQEAADAYLKIDDVKGE